MAKPRLHITRGQYVSPAKLELARKFRKNATLDERTLWNALKADALAGLHFRRQQVIDGFIVDSYCADSQMAIELNGAIHSKQTAEDAERDGVLSRKGIRTMRIVSERVRNELTAVLEEIRAACEGDLTP
jgi:very-short-patch-repair endonuclease